MTILRVMGEFPEAVLGLAFSLGCALLIAFACLKFLIGLMTREQYNVTDAPRRVRAVVWAPDNGAPESSPTDPAGSDTTGGPYLLPAAAPRNRFTRSGESVAAAGGRVVELPQPVRSRNAEGGHRGDGPLIA